MNNKNKVIVIGGGASGMMAAIIAAYNGAEVILLEQLSRVGKKILATGNGRCNISNSSIGIHRYHGKNPRFAYGALNQFDSNATRLFFQDLGLDFIEMDEGKVFPASLQASSVLDVLRYEIESLGIVEKCDSQVLSILTNDKGFKVKLKDGQMLDCHSLVLATGGKANAALGSKGNGYDLVRPFGHKIQETFPSLVQLRLDASFLKGLAGVKFIGEASLKMADKLLRKERGEILFTSYGISGPPILQLSRIAGEKVIQGKSLSLSLDMFPDTKYDELLSILVRRNSLREEKPLDFSFVGLINKKLINVLLRESGIENLKLPCRDVSIERLESIAKTMKSWTIDVIGTQSWKDAQVTAGGIDVSDVNPKTMESKLIAGLYFAGEILDIDGDCGGFNLQWAWSSGYLAGFNASMHRRI